MQPHIKWENFYTACLLYTWVEFYVYKVNGKTILSFAIFEKPPSATKHMYHNLTEVTNLQQLNVINTKSVSELNENIYINDRWKLWKCSKLNVDVSQFGYRISAGVRISN